MSNHASAAAQKGFNDGDRNWGDFTPATGLTVARADPLVADSIHRVQVSQVVGAIPLLLLFHASAAISIHNLTFFNNAYVLAKIWYLSVVFTGMGLAAVFFLWRMGRWHDRPERVLRGLEVLCLLLGFVWATPSAAAVYVQKGSMLFPVAGVSLAVLGIAVTSLLRVPTGAIVFVAMVTASLARALYQSVDGYNLVAALVCAIYGLVLVGITINSHLDFLRRSKAEIEVQRQNEVIRLLLNDFEREAQDWLWETDSDGRLTYYSPRFAEVLNEKLEHLRLRPLRHVLADHVANEDWRKLEQAMAGEATVSDLELALVIAGKPVFWNITAHPLRDHRGRFSGYRGVCRDVTVAKEAQRRIETAMEASERASAAKSQFLAVMSHELRTPINAIVGFSELLARDKDGSLAPQSRVEFAETIMESSRHLQMLINDILDTTRMERGTFQLAEQEIDCAELVEVAIKLCREQADKGKISIVARLSDAVTIKGDSTRLKQVIINLLSNAIKFSSQGGIINIEMQKGPRHRLVLSIKDAGIGIAPDDIERVFEPFVQAEAGLARRFGGAGLGLPIARRIARLHEGEVTLESLPGAGTTARLVLPAHRIIWPVNSAATIRQVA